MYKALAVVFGLMFLNNVASFATTIEGEWNITERKCESASSWESVNGVTVSINLTTKTQSTIIIEDECAVMKISSVEQTSPSTITFCKPVAHAIGPCSQRLLDHVIQVNDLKIACEDEKEVKFSEDGLKMSFSETIQNPGFACAVGEELIYQFERISVNN